MCEERDARNQRLFWFCGRNTAGLPALNTVYVDSWCLWVWQQRETREDLDSSPYQSIAVCMSVLRYPGVWLTEIYGHQKEGEERRQAETWRRNACSLLFFFTHREMEGRQDLKVAHTICRLFSWCDFDWRSFLSCTTSISRLLVSPLRFCSTWFGIIAKRRREHVQVILIWRVK